MRPSDFFTRLAIVASSCVTGCWDWQRFDPVSAADVAEGGLDASFDVVTQDTLDATTGCGAAGQACCADGGLALCDVGLECAAMRCLTPCASNETRCTDACTTLATDPSHCGNCATACSANASCVDGRCVALPPLNDRRSGAVTIDIAASASTFEVDTTSAAHDTTGTCSCSAGADVFYTFTLAQPEIVYADSFGSSFDTALFLQDATGNNIADPILPQGTTCNNRQSIGCTASGSVVTAKLFDGTYYLVLSGCGGGPATVHFQHLPAGGGSFVAITPMPATTQQFRHTLSGVGEVTSSCCSDGPEDTYWWRTCPGSASVALHASTCGGADFDTELDQRSATRSIPVACNNDACGAQSTIDTTTSAGAGLHTLYVDSCGTPAVGDYTLSLTFGDCVATTLCGGRCVDLQTDPSHCATCSTSCTATAPNTVPTCTAGVCGVACAAGFGDCNGDSSDGCESPLDTVTHCGSCGACSTNYCTPACVAGACVLTCDPGWGDCDSTRSNGCEANTRTDRTNCGMCGRRCPGSRNCVAGACV